MTVSPINPNFIKSIDGNFITPIKTTEIFEDGKNEKESFFDVLADAIGGVKAMEKQSEQDSYDLAMGYTDDLDSVMVQSAKTTMAIELTTQLVTQAVNTYKEIIQMQV